MHERRAEPAILRHLPAFLLAMVMVFFVVRNLPWHLDNYDQAKQAFVSYEMVEKGNWWFQHTPSGRIATKPPLAGWISAGLYYLFGKNGWEVAWRIPSFASALILLGLMWRCGGELAGSRGAMIASCAFGFNLLTPHLATLVRTDMFLSLLIFVAGWLVFEKVRTAEAWTTRERVWLALAVLGALLTKGPIIYAFLMPGLFAFWIFTRRRGLPNHSWAGWIPWFAPLLVFAIWVGIGVWKSHEFYRQVVVEEFLGRFDMGEAPKHKHSPFYWYLPHLFHKWAWSLPLLALAFSRKVRERLRTDPALLWLTCWGLGGLIFMSLVPSKRPDRIFPVVPPMCLMLVCFVDAWYCAQTLWHRRVVPRVLAFGILMTLAYLVTDTGLAFHRDQRTLVRLGAQIQEMTRDHPERFALVDANDEGLLLYTHRTKFTALEDALNSWKRGELDRMLIREKDFQQHKEELAPFKTLVEVPLIVDKQNSYYLIEREPNPVAPPQ